MKIASPTPPYCSSCFQAKPALTHIDFESYWDGPIIDGAGFKQPIDDLIICEDCLRVAGEVIGLGDHAKLIEQRNNLLTELKELRKYRIDTEERLERMKELV
jgi:hypothetical protein